MRTYILILLILFSNQSTAQYIQAEYKVEIGYPQGFTLDYIGKYFTSGTKSVEYLLPLYLDKYPSGSLTLNDKLYAVPTDTVQRYSVVDVDSGIVKIATEYGNEYYTFENNFLLWEVFPEIRNIDGLNCQRAQWRGRKDGIVLGEVWFATDIPVVAGFKQLIGIPGLIVELKYGNDYTAKLISYEITSEISPEVFEPKVFNQKRIKFIGHFKNDMTTEPLKEKKPEKKRQSYSDILNQ
ncbi:MAG TPA: hypothetical protein DEU93_07570 [Chitinophagaceae bacterium]|nr:hypothetical protein [Chitinophagaceae bacterium]HML57167.1 hypothetical protein [Ferruginibacter sp.]